MCERFGVTTTFTTEGGDRTTRNQIIERKRAHERYVHLNLCIGDYHDADAVFYLFTYSFILSRESYDEADAETRARTPMTKQSKGTNGEPGKSGIGNAGKEWE